MTMNAKITNKDKLYGNIHVYSIDSKLMFKTNLKKANWYLNNSKKLAEVIEWDDDLNIPKAIKFTFETNGLGYFNKDNGTGYFLSEKYNKCVVTGNEDWQELSKHHIVPYMFFKWLPVEYKSRNCHDVVLITREQHYLYELQANKLKDIIAMELDIPTLSEYSRRISRKASYVGMANAILSNDVPLEKKIDLCIKFRNKTGFVPTTENVKGYINSVKNEYQMAEFYGKYVIEKINNYQEFIERWRKHFIETMKPKYMPNGWAIENNIYTENK